MNNTVLISVVTSLGLLWISAETSRLIRDRVKPPVSASIPVGQRSRHVPSPKVRQKIVHQRSSLARRAVQMTKPAATLPAAQRGTTHPTSIAPPFQGGPIVASTRALRTTTTKLTSTTTSTSTSVLNRDCLYSLHEGCDITIYGIPAAYRIGRCCQTGSTCQLTGEPPLCPNNYEWCCL